MGPSFLLCLKHSTSTSEFLHSSTSREHGVSTEWEPYIYGPIFVEGILCLYMNYRPFFCCEEVFLPKYQISAIYQSSSSKVLLSYIYAVVHIWHCISCQTYLSLPLFHSPGCLEAFVWELQWNGGQWLFLRNGKIRYPTCEDFSDFLTSEAPEKF